MHCAPGAVDEMASKAKAAQAAEDIKVEDAGLQQLAQRIQAEALGLQEGNDAAPHLPADGHELEKLNVRSPVVAVFLSKSCPSPYHVICRRCSLQFILCAFLIVPHCVLESLEVKIYVEVSCCTSSGCICIF